MPSCYKCIDRSCSKNEISCYLIYNLDCLYTVSWPGMSNLLYSFSGMIHAPTMGSTVLSSLFPLVSTSGSQCLERGLSLLQSVLVRVTVAVKSHHEYGYLEVKAFH